MPRLSGRSSRGFGASGSFHGGLGSAVVILEYAAQERVMAQYLYEHAGVPTDGTNGTYAHVALPGALLIDTDNKTLYQNTGTQASPVWTERSATSGGGSGGFQVIIVPISSAEMLDDLPTGTGKTLVEAQGPNTVIWPVDALLIITPGATPYADPNQTQFSVKTGTYPDWESWMTDTGLYNGGFWDAAPGATRSFHLVPSQNLHQLPNQVNKPLIAHLSDAVTDGNGTFLLVVRYIVLTLPY